MPVRKLWTFLVIALFFTVLVYFLMEFLGKEKDKPSLPPLVATEPLKRFRDSLRNSTESNVLASIDNSLTYLRRRGAAQSYSFGHLSISGGELIRTLEEIRRAFQRWGVSHKSYTFLKTNYQFFRSTAERVLVTGYYQARLKGSRKRGGPYQYPLYRKPPDLITLDKARPFGELSLAKVRRAQDRSLVPYYTRAEIDFQGALEGRGLEIVWLDDPIERTFLQIQGSGIVQLDTGDLIQIGYADKNGHPYRPIGRYLIEQDLVPRSEMSMQAIKAFLQENPNRMQEVFTYDPSYVFFTERSDGPYGSLSVPVTAFRSIATDSSLFPKGAFALLQFAHPHDDCALFSEERNGLASLYVLNQDTGGAIRGTGRVDLFVGAGEKEEQLAGKMQQMGELYFLVKAYDSLSRPPPPSIALEVQ